jgi:hypothetical protein
VTGADVDQPGGRAGHRAEPPSRSRRGLPGAVQLLIVLVVSVLVALLGVNLSLSTGEPAKPGSGPRPDVTGLAVPPPVTVPVLSPTAIGPTSGPTTTPAAPAPSRPPASKEAPAALPPAPIPRRVVDDFDDGARWRQSENDLGQWTGADTFVNGGGAVAGGGLTLVYDDDGWFGSDVYTNVSAYHYLVLRLAGAHGGEQKDFHLLFGGTEHRFADLLLDGGQTPVVTTAYQDIRIPMSANGMNTTGPRDLQLSFWWGGRSTLLIDEIHFE